jgi:ubiquinone/menaquinone biosynthesis C-methylase UbiE
MRRPLASTKEWQAIGKGPRPLYHVLTWPGMGSDWSAEDFYATGESDWQDFRAHWEPFPGGTCVEIGCGPGRMTRALAHDFERVVGLDVSPDLVERARAAVPDNVDLELVQGTEIPLPGASADAVFSVHVFMHLERAADVEAYLREARRVLRPGGSAMVHIPIAPTRPGVRARLRAELRVWRSRRELARGREHSVVRYRQYVEDDVRAMFERAGFSGVELRLIPVRTNGYRHHFWLARP